MLKEKTFREDLFYRLNVISFTVPPLRERREDRPLLVDHFLNKYNETDKVPTLSKATEKLLLNYDYPGNVRELENIIQRGVILCRGQMIEPPHLPEAIQAALSYSSHDDGQHDTFQKRKQHVIEKFERQELTRILTLTGGRVRESAKVAGMDVKNLSEKLRKYEIKASNFRKKVPA